MILIPTTILGILLLGAFLTAFVLTVGNFFIDKEKYTSDNTDNLLPDLQNIKERYKDMKIIINPRPEVTMRKLATIRKISSISPIEGADKIEVATVDGWNVVVGKDVNHKVGDLVIYCEIDSFLPIHPDFEFLRKTSYSKMGDLEGFRLKTIRLRGVLSQGLILPLSVLNSRGVTASQQDTEIIGMDVTSYLDILKYDRPIPAQLAGKIKGKFPSFIPKTDEERIQNLSDRWEEFREVPFTVTEKLDGSSVTYYVNGDTFGVCSRNWELSEDDSNSLWMFSKREGIEEKLRSLNKSIALQGEIVGPGIQGNPYKLSKVEVYFFTAYDIEKGVRYSPKTLYKLIQELGLNSVPVKSVDFFIKDHCKSIETLLLYAEGKSELNSQTEREGLVFRDLGGISFKVISNKFLLKNE